MNKILKKYTTIPETLYISRNADFQLKRIIEEMQRPGYVLVARQMGKTNLLFNAKRVLENESRIFAYVDLSNLYENERDCYRNIINNIIEPNDKLTIVESGIEVIRSKNLPAHNEYSRSLRVILDSFSGDLVIVLDEIDALKSVSYSDNIFAQIRSNYFSRTSYPVFERLTYVLSGVIEPTELIKDRNKSPFNIGEKIYLDDFSEEEYNDFIWRSKLSISSEIKNEIYEWTNGNPRLTFDVCSEVESFLNENNSISKADLEQLIKDKYLTSYDIAPVDHIREIVKTNNQIRNSLKLIHRNKCSQLSDDAKKKLYLYGIINSKFDEQTTIKNKILSKSLTEEWIKSIDKDQEISLVAGLVKYENKEFEESRDIFEKLISDPNIKKSDIESANYFIGLSYFRQEEFEKAIPYFDKNFATESYSADVKSFMGICKIATGLKEDGIRLLEDVVVNETYNYAYHNALLNLALNIDDQDKAIILFKKLYDSTFKDTNENPEELEKLRAISLFNQAEIYLEKEDTITALEVINNGISNTSKSDSLYFIYLKFLLRSDDGFDMKSLLVDTILKNNLVFSEEKSNSVSFTNKTLYKYLDILFDNNDNTFFESLLNYSVSKLFFNTSRNEILLKTAINSIYQTENLFEYLLAYKSELSEDILFGIYKNLSLTTSKVTRNFSFYFNKYFYHFNNQSELDGNDIFLFALEIKIQSDLFKIERALDLCDKISLKLKLVTDENLKFEFLIIYYWYANLYFSKKNRTLAIRYSDYAMDLIDNSSRRKTSMIDEKGVSTIKEQLLQIKESSEIHIPIINEKKYGRNDRIKVQYVDGTILEKKYKLLEPDILAERCKII